MPRRTLLITGASGGIGLETCKCILNTQLVARRPTTWHVILAQRDPTSEKAQAAESLLREIAIGSDSTVVSLTCDLSSLAAVRTFAAEIADEVLDIVILNTGIVMNTWQQSVDGNELTYQVNHIGHFLLLDLIHAQVKDLVIFVSSSLHQKADVQKTFDSMKVTNPTADHKDHRGLEVYRQSKLLQAYCLAHWHRILKEQNTRVVSVQPGFVPSSNLSRDMPLLYRLGMQYVIHYLPFARTLAEAGETVAAVAIAEEYTTLDNVCIASDLQVVSLHPDAYNSEHSDFVWKWSQNLIK